MSILNFNDINAVKDFKIQEVPVKEWGGSVMLRTISGTDREEFESFMMSKTDKNGNVADSKLARVNLLVRCICDADGKLIFDTSANKMSVLNSKSADVLGRLFAIATEMNGLNDGAVETAKKN